MRRHGRSSGGPRHNEDAGRQSPPSPNTSRFWPTPSTIWGICSPISASERRRGKSTGRRATCARSWSSSSPPYPFTRWNLRHHNNLGILFQALRKREEASGVPVGLDLRKKLAEQFPAVTVYQIELGGSYCNYGNLIRDEGKAAESLPWYDLAVRTLKPVARQGTARRDCQAVPAEQSRGQGDRPTTALQKPAEAVKDWDRAIELSPLAERAGPRASRATFSLSGRPRSPRRLPRSPG